MEFFNTSLPELLYGENRSNSSTKSVSSAYPEVVLWDRFENELKDFQIQNNDLTLEYLIESPELRLKIRNEIQVKSAINDNVFKPLSQYLRKKEINSFFQPCSSNEHGVIGQPDFAFFHNDIVKLVIEVKTIWSLTAPDNLAAAYRISSTTVRLPVQQIFGYMRINNLKYGILTNYESFYFMRREKLLLHISTAIKSADVDLSVYRALFYIIHLSIEDHLCSPNTSINDDKKCDSDQDEIQDDEKDDESEEDDDNNDVYSPKRKKKRSEQYQSSKSKQIKLMNEAIGYGQNGCVFKCLYNNTEYATKICDTTKNTNMMMQLNNERKLYNHLKLLQGTYVPNRIVSGFLKNLNWFYIVCYEISGVSKSFKQYTNEEKVMALTTLDQLHKRNVLHNDIRSENFLINYDNQQHKRIMLCDFGNSMILNDSNNVHKRLLEKEKKELKKLLNYAK
ncbi:unnamed protein product [Rotaria magnacalcarata]|nr:unnamed protein product [Rotaria magnacalcarata]